ncbi:MAG: putative glycosyltransferase, exosortase G system-associated [Lachnospiraceae bacterium]|nr:putative glycosyltransferase, exosortase G system-associated [Lachnospiraceae bacterium]
MIAKLANEIFFWAAWIIIPLLLEIVPAIGNFVILLMKRIRTSDEIDVDFLPNITLMIPVYNSGGTLYRCIESIHRSTYPDHLVEIMLVDNGSKDDSFAVFQKAQMDFPTLPMWWMNSKQGKSKALNKAIFNSNGKYIINIDSDGVLHEKALMNIVRRFETCSDVDCMTGVILIEPALIEQTKGFFLKQFRKLEFMEYAQAFLAGRNFESQFNSIYTLSGAFSSFRKSVLLKTFLYNTNTICEDTHLTFQVRSILGKKVHLCNDAVFMVDPIESVNKFYTQRQRWQIGELEVAHMFLKEKLHNPISGYFNNFVIRLLMTDHTFAFPRMIWYFVLIALGCMNYSFHNIAVACILIYLLYVFSSFLYYLNIISFLRVFPDLRRYYARKLLYVAVMPIFNLFAFFVRFAGIINSIRRKSSWKTLTFTEESRMVEETVKGDFSPVLGVRRLLLKILEKQEKKEEQNVKAV